MANIKESAIEQYLAERVKAIGGLCIKTTSPGLRGFFDRVVVVDGRVVFVETKRRRGSRVSPQQKALHIRFAVVGAWVEIVRSHRAVDALVDLLSRRQE
jgi:hypothetical protein